jgi:hypothetical protein
MTELCPGNYPYQPGGSLPLNAPSYVVRQADTDLYEALLAGNLCYVLDARQIGKSSLGTRTRHRLQQIGIRCATLDLTLVAHEQVTPQEWYLGIIADLLRSFHLLQIIDLKTWWHHHAHLRLHQRVSLFLEAVLLAQFPNDRLVIFVDEVDKALSLPFPAQDFFTLIQDCYVQRGTHPAFNRLDWALFGVATVSDLIGDCSPCSPPSQVIELHSFQEADTQALLHGLASYINRPEAVLQEILHWTGGQPFLTQKLCKYIVETCSSRDSKLCDPGDESRWIKQLVQARIIQSWEAQDQPEHLKTIRDRLLIQDQRTGHLLRLYQQILARGSIAADGSSTQADLLLSGLVTGRQGWLSIKNPIYRSVFDLSWVEQQLNHLPPPNHHLLR